MCSDRLSLGEAPACVQGCPNEAIAIRVIDQRQALEDAQGDAFLPGTPSPAITVPTTVYRTAHPPPRNLLPADFYNVTPSHRHAPLVVMLVLTQLSVGAFVVDAVVTRLLAHVLQPAHAIAALVVGLAALAASTFHLGRPLYAFRAVLGLRTSWMSREILAFGAFAVLAMTYAVVCFTGIAPFVREALGGMVAAIGVIGIACSVLIYHVTRKAWWSASLTGFKFFMTAAVLGLASTIVTERDLCVLSQLVVVACVIKVAGELAVFVHLRDKRYTELKRSAMLLAHDLRHWTQLRFVAIAFGGIVIPLVAQPSLGSAIASFVLLVIGELLERTLFFAAASAPGMPKGVR
jgi:DMSO reductase anchor subunit